MEVSQSISGCRHATTVLLDAVDGLTDAQVRRPSLPGWSVGPVLSHLARNADSHRRMIDGAAEGRVIDHELRRQLAALAHRLPGRLAVLVDPTDRDWDVAVMGTAEAELQPVVEVSGTSRQLLAWLVGRGPGGTSWPTLAGWTGVP